MRGMCQTSEVLKNSMRGKSYDENIIINLVNECIENNIFKKLRYSYVITLHNFRIIEFTYNQNKKRLLKFDNMTDLVDERLAIFLDGYITMAESSKAFSDDTLAIIRSKINDYTKN